MSKKEDKRQKKLQRKYEKLDILQKRVSIANEMSKIYDDEGKAYFKVDWIKKNILKIKD
jgi:hypothetical protein